MQCENLKRRGDEEFDRAEQLQSILNHTEESNDELADRLRERDDEIARLQKLLDENNISYQIEEQIMKEEQMVKQEFRVGDIVKCTFYGDREFELFDCSDNKYPLKIDSDDTYEMLTIDGKYSTDHTHPVLTLIRRPSDMIKKEIVLVGFVVHGESFIEMVKGSDDYNHSISKPDRYIKVSERTIEVVG